MNFLSVIIPAYNEGPRITQALRNVTDYLKSRPFRWEILVVDDGSRDDTGARVQQMTVSEPRIRLIHHSSNQGKGGAVRTGLRSAKGDAVLFCDADGATPIEELERLLPPLQEGAGLVSGSRRLQGSQIVVAQAWLRRGMSGGYRWLCKIFVSPGISDVTCGFKLLSQQAVDLFVPRMKISGWSFDAEMFTIARIHRLRTVEVPVRWIDQKKTKVRLVRDAWGSFRELCCIAWNSTQGVYR